ncbi:hypothetical protein LB503_006463 [Fusarium chuoi]|nr:hypothetical protein LB503_006463 [Fusarium chuoi]
MASPYATPKGKHATQYLGIPGPFSHFPVLSVFPLQDNISDILYESPGGRPSHGHRHRHRRRRWRCSDVANSWSRSWSQSHAQSQPEESWLCLMGTWTWTWTYQWAP